VNRRRRWLVGLLLLGVLLGLPRCVSFRMSDQKIDRYFADKAAKPQFGYVEAGGRRVHYARLTGPQPGADTLPTVVFVHGSPGSWDAFIDFFADSSLYSRAQLIAVDRPGFGKSGQNQPERSLRAQAAALAPVLALGGPRTRPILVGHSLGGPVVARLAMDYPDRVGGLVLVAPSIDPALEPDLWYRRVGNWFPFRQMLPTELDVSNQEILPLKGELAQMMSGWATIRVPVIVIQGTDDDLVPAGNADFAKRMLTNAPLRVQMLPQMNHFIPWRRPDTIHDAILSLITRHQQPISSN
jgi:pimeloyl-ACP methyl ester carboxylesterase